MPSQRVHAFLSLDFETPLYIRRNKAPDWRRNVADSVIYGYNFEIRNALYIKSWERLTARPPTPFPGNVFYRPQLSPHREKGPFRPTYPHITYLFPQIVAIGRNYAEHVKELNNTAPTEPFFFLKPTTSYLPSGGTLEIPRGIIAHHEGTLAINFSCNCPRSKRPQSNLASSYQNVAGTSIPPTPTPTSQATPSPST